MSTPPTDRPAPSPIETGLKDAVFLITGGGSGIGEAIAAAAAAAGARVAVADLDGEAARAQVDGHHATLAFEADVRDPNRVEEVVAALATEYGRIDVLVNNAGIARVESLLEQSPTVWRETFAVNVEGALHTIRSVGPRMIEQDPRRDTTCRGKIVNISSPAAEIGRPLLAAYGASKAALNHLSMSTAAALGPQGIATTILYPGNVQGAMWPGLGEQLAAHQGTTVDEVIAARLRAAPSGRFQMPAEVAHAALYIAMAPGLELNGKVLWTEPHVTDP